jgi:hypothetical protein
MEGWVSYPRPNIGMQKVYRFFRNPLLITLALFALAVFFVDYRGDFAVNDDWIFVRQIEAFFKHQWELSALIDPSFISQGLLGYVWGMSFGVGFVQLRVLTLLLTVLLLVVMHKVLKLLGVNPRLKFACLLLVAFNPLIFTSAFSFMTEIYFLLFYVLGLLFYLKHFERSTLSYLVLGSLFTGLAILVRQAGVVPFIAYVIVAIYKKRASVIKLVVATVPIALGFWAYSVWPRYLDTGVSGGYAGLLSNLIDPGDIPQRLYMMFLSLPYFAFFILPLLFLNKKENLKELPLWAKVLALVVFVYIADQLFKLDVFPVGSVFYVEGLHGKSNYRSFFSIFDNIVFKDFLSVLISLGLVRFSLLLRKKNKLDVTGMFLLLNVLGSFAISMFGNDYYDRYLLAAFVSFLLFFVHHFRDRVDFKTRFQWVVMGVIVIMSVLHQHEYFAHTRLRWEQARKLQWDKGFISSIFVDGTYAKYYAARKTGNYTGDASGDPPGEFNCYVQKYTKDTDSGFFKMASWVDQTTKEYVKNPEIYNAKRNRKIPTIKKHLDELSYNEEYFSPIFNLVGKRAYVGSWCYEKD